MQVEINPKQEIRALKSVLILEDEAIFKMILRHIIRGFTDVPLIAQVEHLSSCHQLLETVKFDLIILDIMLNIDFCTPEIVWALHKQYPKMKILVISGIDVIDHTPYLQSGATHFIKKSGNIKSDLSTVLNRLFND